MGDNSPCHIEGKGSIRVKMFDGTIITSRDVRYILKMKRNLISLSALDDKGPRLHHLPPTQPRSPEARHAHRAAGHHGPPQAAMHSRKPQEVTTATLPLPTRRAATLPSRYSPLHHSRVKGKEGPPPHIDVVWPSSGGALWRR
jgi:hypothetical protein